VVYRTLLGATTVSFLVLNVRLGKKNLDDIAAVGGVAVVINESNWTDVTFLLGAESNDSKQLPLDI
jgi:hypothetical protein